MRLTEAEKEQIAAFIPYSNKMGGKWDRASKSVFEQVERIMTDRERHGDI